MNEQTRNTARRDIRVQRLRNILSVSYSYHISQWIGCYGSSNQIFVSSWRLPFYYLLCVWNYKKKAKFQKHYSIQGQSGPRNHPLGKIITIEMSPFINDKCMLFKWVLINLVFSKARPDYHDNSPSNSSFLNGRFVLTSYIRQSTSQFTVCTLAILKHLILRTISVFCNPWDWIYLNTKTELLWNMSETMKQEEVEEKNPPFDIFQYQTVKNVDAQKNCAF